jgi:hypothetical protein
MSQVQHCLCPYGHCTLRGWPLASFILAASYLPISLIFLLQQPPLTTLPQLGSAPSLLSTPHSFQEINKYLPCGFTIRILQGIHPVAKITRFSSHQEIKPCILASWACTKGNGEDHSEL